MEECDVRWLPRSLVMHLEVNALHADVSVLKHIGMTSTLMMCVTQVNGYSYENWFMKTNSTFSHKTKSQQSHALIVVRDELIVCLDIQLQLI